jgi:hypothetical protein
MARERQRVERHAGLVILGALRRHHARCQCVTLFVLSFPDHHNEKD